MWGVGWRVEEIGCWVYVHRCWVLGIAYDVEEDRDEHQPRDDCMREVNSELVRRRAWKVGDIGRCREMSGDVGRWREIAPAYVTSIRNMTVVQRMNPSRPTDQWNQRHFGRQWGSWAGGGERLREIA